MHSACHTIALKCLHGKARALIEAACVGGTRITGKTENLSATYTHTHTQRHQINPQRSEGAQTCQGPVDIKDADRIVLKVKGIEKGSMPLTASSVSVLAPGWRMVWCGCRLGHR